MIKSMTGFGRSICEMEGKSITIEIKTLNSKQIDIYTRVPSAFKEKELFIRNAVSNKFNRGKIEVIISVEQSNSTDVSIINKSAVKTYFKQLDEIQKELNITEENILGTIMRLPDTMLSQKEELTDQEWAMIVSAIEKAMEKVDAFRMQEGQALIKDILERIEKIKSFVLEVKPFEKERINAIKERIEKTQKDFLNIEKLDSNRFEQELIYYLEKIDISEEVVRLNNHCEFFNQVVEKEANIGKKLGFIAQEIGREINTIGSKANNSDIQRVVVLMKDELEKIKEQLMNIL